MEVEFRLVDEEIARLLRGRVDQHHDELGQASPEFGELVRLTVDDKVERVVGGGSLDFQTTKPEQSLDVGHDRVAGEGVFPFVSSLHVPPTFNERIAN